MKMKHEGIADSIKRLGDEISRVEIEIDSFFGESSPDEPKKDDHGPMPLLVFLDETEEVINKLSSRISNIRGRLSELTSFPETNKPEVDRY